jgi:hypothetical protein
LRHGNLFNRCIKIDMHFQKIVLLVITVFTLSGFADNKCKCDLDNDNLKGRVKQLREEQKTEPVPGDTAPRGRANENPYAYSVWTYNEQGNLKEKNYYDDKGRLAHQEKTTYDEHGQKTEGVTSTLVNGKLQKTEQYLYVRGKLAENLQFNTEKIKTRQVKYDGDGNAYQSITFNAGGSVDRKTDSKFIQDSAGRVVEEDVYANDTMYTGKTTYKYDQMGNQSEVANYNRRDIVTYKRVITNTYDSTGRLIGSVEDYIKVGGILRFSLKIVYKYDAAGNRNEEDSYTIKGRIEQPGNVRLYENDKTGNWIKRTDILRNGERLITMHTIQYY